MARLLLVCLSRPGGNAPRAKVSSHAARTLLWRAGCVAPPRDPLRALDVDFAAEVHVGRSARGRRSVGTRLCARLRWLLFRWRGRLGAGGGARSARTRTRLRARF